MDKPEQAHTAMQNNNLPPGIGRNPTGLPDILWRSVPEGDFIFGRGAILHLPEFYIAQYPVTHTQFQIFIDYPDGYANPVWWEGLSARGIQQQASGPVESAFAIPDHPRVNVSWYEAVAYARWLSAKLNYEIAIPTEQQWEKAARGADGRLYPYGNAFDRTKGNAGNSGIGMTSRVDKYPDGVSPCGAIDMSGNTWEWCINEYHDPDPEIRPSNSRRVLKGGSWSCGPISSRADGCKFFYRDYRFNNVGFRLIRPNR